MSFNCFHFGLGFDVVCPEYCCIISSCLVGGGIDLEDFIRAEVWRTLNAVGRWTVIVDNTDGKYNALTGLDIQGDFHLETCDLTLMRGRIDGPGITLNVVDAESDFKELIILQGVDQMQDFLFHNDFEYSYTTATQTIGGVLDNIINTQIGYGAAIGQTNIAYTDPGGTPAMGGVEFREGGSFLGIIQDMHRAVDRVFYVDDNLNLQSDVAGTWGSGVTLQCIEGNPLNNIIRVIDWNRRSGGKLYNYVKLYGKSPQFDAYTEENAGAWTAFPVPGNPTDDTTTTIVNNYSLRVTNTAAPGAGSLRLTLTCPVFNYASWDFTKGRIGVWLFFDDPGGTYGTPQRMALNCRLTDTGGAQIDYFEGALAATGKTRSWRDEWGFCEFPLGEDVNYTGAVNLSGEWCSVLGVTFDWEHVTEMDFQLPRPGLVANEPANMYLDGLTIPVAPIGLAQDAAAQATYRWRPLILQAPNIQTQNAIQQRADDFLAYHKDTNINYLKVMCAFDPRLRYAGQSVIVNIPTLGLNTANYYLTSIHHVIEPKTDISGGYGFDCITEVEAIPIVARAYDFQRLSPEPVISTWTLAERSGTGLRLK